MIFSEAIMISCEDNTYHTQEDMYGIRYKSTYHLSKQY